MSESSETIVAESAPACDHPRIAFNAVTAPRGSGKILTIQQFRCADCGAPAAVIHGKGQYAGIVQLPVSLDFQHVAPQVAAPPAKSETPKEPQPPGDPAKGLPGTEMLSLTAELGIESKPGCGCKGTAAMMDRLGVEGCRNRATELVLLIESNWESWGWRDKLKAATNAAWKAAGLGVNPTDPVRSLVNLAIDRAEQKIPRPTETGG